MKKCQLIILLLVPTIVLFSQVKVYQGKEVIPTYALGENEVSPIFYTGKGVQGAEGRVYPYAAQTNLSDSLVDVTYDMVYLENEYVKVSILPAFGGRLFSAIDKTNGHELFHTNSTIKPDLIGTLGAWVSGGIEWCFPHHHRTTTMTASDYIMITNEDGSATVWIGETEKTMRLRGVVGITLRPESSYIETDYRINNTNTLTKTFLFWANVAITADKNFRTFWPPSQEIGVGHNNAAYTEWPISNQKYWRTDYTDGVDLTWWKNHPNPVSFFFWKAKEGFIGGYDYGKKAGTVHVGDIYENKTSKLWQFGPGLAGQNARRKLTDDNKAYVELMTGTFSNNQPDYSWIAPHSVKDAKNYWYPLRDIEVVKNANVDASVTLQLKDKKTVFYGFNTTKVFKNATVELTYKEKVLSSKVIDIGPATPFSSYYKSKKDIEESELSVAIKDTNGNSIIAYTPYIPTEKITLPQRQQRPKKHTEIDSVEDLYLTGRFVEQSFKPWYDPDDYYLAALQKSPNDSRVLIALGIRRLHQYKYEQALQYFKNASDKLQIEYYQPKEGELYYYMALAQKKLGKLEAAYKNFSQATWYYAWHSSGYYELALLESNFGNYTKALEYIQNAYSTNTKDGRIVWLYSALLRKLKKYKKANELLDGLLAYDPLNFAAYYEKNQLAGSPSLKKWHQNMQDITHNYLEITTQYMNAGFIKDGIDLLSSIENPTNPLIDYYLAWFYEKKGDQLLTTKFLKRARNKSIVYCFPYREETEIVLRKAIEIDNSDAVAYYLLGNLLYDTRPEEAIAAWKQASVLAHDIPMIWRNLAFGAFYHQSDADAAVAYMIKAMDKKRDIPLWYTELAKYYDLSSRDIKECIGFFQEYLPIVKKGLDAPRALVKMYTLNGDYDKAIKLLENHHFRTWEGKRDVYWNYVDVHVLQAKKLMKQKEFDKAKQVLENALKFPKNLEVGKGADDGKNALIYYHMGLIAKNLSEKEEAIAYFKKSKASVDARNMADMLYFKGKSMEELGNKEEAKKLFKELIEKGNRQIRKGIENSGIAVEDGAVGKNIVQSKAHYLVALGYKGLGDAKKSEELFVTALEEYKNNLWAKEMKKN